MIHFNLCSGADSNVGGKDSSIKVKLTVWVYVFVCMTSVNWVGANVTHIVDGNNKRGVKRGRSGR